MNKYQEIKCIKLDRPMTAGKCLRLQDEAIKTFGADKAGKCSTCPCDQGRKIKEEIAMAQSKRRECWNCKRIMSISQAGLCGGCFNRIKGKTGEERDQALALAAEQFGGMPPGERAPQRKYTKGPRVKPVIQDAVDREEPRLEHGWVKQVIEGAEKHPGLVFEPVPAPDPDLNLPLLTVIVNFTDGDGPLFDGLMKLGRKYRRSPDQQLLWLLEKELHNEGIMQADPAMFLYPVKGE